MLTSYITDKECFCFLYELLGGKKTDVPEKLMNDIFLEGIDSAVRKLEKQGYIHVRDNRIDVERTIRFLVTSIIKAKSCTLTENGRGYIFECADLSVIAEEDRLSPRKCRIIPIKDIEMLDEYNSDNLSVSDEEEDE